MDQKRATEIHNKMMERVIALRQAIQMTIMTNGFTKAEALAACCSIAGELAYHLPLVLEGEAAKVDLLKLAHGQVDIAYKAAKRGHNATRH